MDTGRQTYFQSTNKIISFATIDNHSSHTRCLFSVLHVSKTNNYKTNTIVITLHIVCSVESIKSELMRTIKTSEWQKCRNRQLLQYYIVSYACYNSSWAIWTLCPGIKDCFVQFFFGPIMLGMCPILNCNITVRCCRAFTVITKLSHFGVYRG